MRPEPDDKPEQSERQGPAKKTYKTPSLRKLTADEARKLLQEQGVELEELPVPKHDQD